MSETNAYKQKLEAEIEQAEAKLEDLKAEAKSCAADATIRTQYDQRVKELEQYIDAAKAKLKELGGAAVGDSAAKAKEKFNQPIE